MKARLFAAFFFILTTTFILGGYLYSWFAQRERLLLIDSQIETRTDELMRSRSLLKALDDESIDWESNEIIQQVLGDYRVGFFVLVREREGGDVVFENDVSKRLDINPALDQKWQTFRVRDYYVRAHSLPIPSKPYLLQTGYVLKETSSIFFRPTVSLLFVVMTITGVLIFSYLLSNWIFKPLTHLSRQIRLTLDHFSAESIDSLISAKELNPSHGFFLNRDESSKLFGDLRLLLDRTADLIRQNTFHSSQLAHQIMTPLTVIKAVCEQKPETHAAILTQVNRLTAFVRKYLDWSELNNSIREKTTLYSISVREELQKLVDELGPLAQNRVQIQLKSSSQVRVLADRLDFIFLIENLISNALKFSGNKPVHVLLDTESITIQDQGPGIPDSVLKNLGTPFNSGHQVGVESTGLGLAIASSIAGKYGWNLEFNKTNPGTEVSIHFGAQEEAEAV